MGNATISKRRKRGGYPYSMTQTHTMPELMRRMAVASVEAPARFSCRVADIESRKKGLSIACTSFTKIESIIMVSSTPPAINVGDVVSVPLANQHRDPEGVLYKEKGVWVVDADAKDIAIETKAVCPSLDEIKQTIESR